MRSIPYRYIHFLYVLSYSSYAYIYKLIPKIHNAQMLNILAYDWSMQVQMIET